MIRKFRFRGSDVAGHIRDTYGFDGELLDIFAGNEGPLVHKWHHYIPLYDRYFGPWKGRAPRFLEIGVSKGGSLQLWRRFFGPEAVIFGIDIDPRCARFDGQAGQVRIGSQDDPEFLASVVEEMGGLDLVVDDGSHVMAHIEASLACLFPRLASDGIYLIEDLHTAYWEDWGGGVDRPENFFNSVRRMIDGMHRWYHDAPGARPGIEGRLAGIHVHDSLVVLEKGPGAAPVHSKIGGAGGA